MMRPSVIFAFLLLLAVPAQAAEPLLEKIDLFEPGMNGIAHYRIPGIVVTAKGTLLAYCEARKLDRKDWGEIEIHLRRSTDGGKTWSPARQIAHLGERIEGNPRKTSGGEREQTVNNPVAIVDRETGAIEFLYCINYARCFSMRSTDDGLTFSKAVEITAAFEPFRAKYAWKVIATGPGHGIQLASGRLVVPIWLAYGEPGEHAPSASGTIFSDDHGKSWKAGDIVVPNDGPFKNSSESILTQLEDGRVMMVTRSVSEPNRKLVSTSPDGARNWTTPRFHPELWEPICMASITNYPKVPGTLIFSNPHSLQRDESGKEVPGGRGRRENLSIKLSRDSGQTWPVNKTLEAGPSAYSDLAVLADGTVICFYERSTRLSVARFNMEWLTGAGDPAGKDVWLANGFTEAQRESLREAFRWGIENHFIPGGAMLIIRGGEVVFREAFGVADLETGKPFAVDAPCRIASVTKPHTTTLIAMLVEQGKLAWDDPLDKYLPRFSGVTVRGKGPAARSPRIRELLSHTAGFPSQQEKDTEPWKFKTDGTLAEAVDDIARAGLATEPGSVFAYTGVGYMVAGRVAEVVTGQEFAALMRERLLLPLGATTVTFYPFASRELKAKMPVMYERQGDRLVRADEAARSEREIAFPNPGGGLVSTLDDIGRFLMLHRNRGEVGGKRLVSPDYLSALYRPQPATGREAYGMGFNILRTDSSGGGDRVRHTGASGTLVLLDFKQDLFVVVLTQVPTKQRLPFGNRLNQAINSLSANR